MHHLTIKISLTIAVALGAFFLGSLVGDFIGQKKKSRSRDETSQSVLKEMHELNVGDTLENHFFERLGMDSVWLKDLLSGRSVIIVVSPECPSCMDEILELKSAFGETDSGAANFIFASWGNPRTLEDIRDQTKLKSPFLYDHRKAYFSRYDIFTFPFNITVDENAVVLDMLAGAMLKEEFEEIIEYNKSAEQELD